MARGLCNACYLRAQRAGTLQQHVYKKGVPAAWLTSFLKNLPDTNNCIEWPFGRDKGYGTLWWDGRCQRASRIILAHVTGQSMDGFEACHSCDNPPCVNPRHLFVGTHHANMIDATMKLKMRKKLTPADVTDIRALKGTLFQREIAALYGITQTVVGDIHRREKWQYI